MASQAMAEIDIAIAVHELRKKRLEPIPIKPRAKHPVLTNWVDADCDAIINAGWPQGYGVGLRTGSSVLGLDIDVYDVDIISGVLEHIRTNITPNYITRTGMPPKKLVPFVCSGIQKKITSTKYMDQNNVIQQIEILSKGQQFVVYGIHPDTQKNYEWDGDLLSHSLPVFTLEQIHDVLGVFDKFAETKNWVNLSVKEQKVKKVIRNHQPINKGDSPIAIYNRSASIVEVLEYYGWKHYRGQYWTRPNKETGVSGSVFNNSILWPFTSATCLDEGKPHDAFEILARYGFEGNKAACARVLRSHIKEVNK